MIYIDIITILFLDCFIYYSIFYLYLDKIHYKVNILSISKSIFLFSIIIIGIILTGLLIFAVGALTNNDIILAMVILLAALCICIVSFKITKKIYINNALLFLFSDIERKIDTLSDDEYKKESDIYDIIVKFKRFPLEDYGWYDINRLVELGLHTEIFNIGDTKSFRIGKEKVTVQIAGFNHDHVMNNSPNSITFVSKYTLEDYHTMDIFIHNNWMETTMYTYLNNYLYSNLPYDLRDSIKYTYKKYTSFNKDIYLYEMDEQPVLLWLLSKTEVSGEKNECLFSEGKQYELFKDKRNWIKTNPKNIDAAWWLRSLNCSLPLKISEYYIVSNVSTYTHPMPYLFDYGVVFGFCI